jgi:hypothetical protein
MVSVVMKQQMSGARADGRAWPPPDVEFEVDTEEARFLTRTTDSSPDPIAVYAEKRTETGDAPEKRAETREAVVPETRVTSGRPGAGKGRPAPIVRK